ncbi:hypothetical protein ACFS5N_04915 [Mucilaginibacter ximonensis]|uniref:Uncharacterized protein n=1 Tax=Mucilaginibacter ximonensis TaxID=538021 RepID=A0ABW5Y983_9SPHI
MKTYIPKIVITQQPGTDKPCFENEDGEMFMLIEDNFDNSNNQPADNYQLMVNNRT